MASLMLDEYGMYKNVIYFKDNFTLKKDSQKRGVPFKKNVPYVISHEENKYMIGRMRVTPNALGKILRFDGKVYDFNEYYMDSILDHADAVFPEDIQGKLDNNLLLETRVNIGNGDESVSLMLNKLEPYIVSSEYGKRNNKSITINLFIKKGTYLHLNLSFLKVLEIDDYKLDIGSDLYINGYKLEEKSFTKIVYSFYNEYK